MVPAAPVTGSLATPPGSTQQGLSYTPILNRMAVRFQAPLADVGEGVAFQIFLKRVGIPGVNPIPGAAVIFGGAGNPQQIVLGDNVALVDFSSAFVSVLPGQAPTLQPPPANVFGNPSTQLVAATGLQTYPGDVISCQAVSSTGLAAPITDVMVALG
jgi:hypothetical protein